MKRQHLPTTALDYQSLQTVLHRWRQANPWADDIPYTDFPEQYRDEMELEAHINQHGHIATGRSSGVLPASRRWTASEQPAFSGGRRILWTKN